MGDPRYIEKIASLYGITFSNMTELKQKNILLLLKQTLTKKEYKLMFTLMDETPEVCMQVLQCDSQALELLARKALRKLKHSPLQNQITEIAEQN